MCQEDPRTSQDAARLATSGTQNAHHGGLGQIVRNRRERRRVVAIAAAAQHVEELGRDFVARRTETDGRRPARLLDTRLGPLDLVDDSRPAQANQIVRMRVAVTGDLVTSLGQIREDASSFGILQEIATYGEQRGANTVASKQLAKPRKRAPQNGIAGVLGRRLAQSVDSVVALDSVEVDGHRNDRIGHRAIVVGAKELLKVERGSELAPMPVT